MRRRKTKEREREREKKLHLDAVDALVKGCCTDRDAVHAKLESENGRIRKVVISFSINGVIFLKNKESFLLLSLPCLPPGLHAATTPV